MAAWFAEVVDRLGVPRDAYIGLREAPTARHLRYMDLMAPLQKPAAQTGELPDGVVEVSGKAVLYVVREPLMAGAASGVQLVQLMRTLACRADAAYLAVVSPATTTIYPIGFYRENEPPVVDRVIEAHDVIGLRNLLNGEATDSPQGRADKLWLDDLLFNLLTDSAEALRAAFSTVLLADEDVLSLIGRALFTRFLLDRNIVKGDDIAAIFSGAQRPEVLFSSMDTLVATFQWLDRTFNGDLLELSTKDYHGFMARLGPAASTICAVLSDVMSRAPGGQLSLDWDGLRFQHIPVDVLSQVYEHFAHRFMPEQARKTSIHYTPRGIAQLLVDGVFGATPAGKRHCARVLDPAVGAGVFLVLAFRRLVAEHWLHSGKRPRRATIRRILTQQLCGLDINPTSIKIAALSLYLAALELDPQPQPLSDLRFERLFDATLHCVDQAHLGNAVDAELGSLSAQLRMLGPFDIVLANPPWTRFPGRFKKLLDQVAWDVEEASTAHGKSLVPNQWPDLAFLWRSVQWCKPSGVIGLLVHARLLFSEEAAAVRARWFTRTRVTGILNGMFLRKDRRIWPSNTQPFCALVSINEAAGPEDSFYFLVPRHEPALARRREFRLDPRSALPVPAAMAAHELHAFKTLARGSALDLELISRLGAEPRIPMRRYFEREGLDLLQGFIAGTGNFQDASALRGIAVLEGTDKPLFVIATQSLDRIESRYPEFAIHRPRDPAIYTGPHLLFREAPKQDPAHRGALWTDGDVAFSRSFYGVRIPEAKTTIGDYLYVLSYADLLMYWVLMTSSKFGVERDIFNKEDYGNFPVAPLESLSSTLKRKLADLATSIRSGHQPWMAVNTLVSQIYGLTVYDQALIADALAYESPFSKIQASSLTVLPRKGKHLSTFAASLSSLLSEAEDGTITATPLNLCTDDGLWQFLRVVQGTPADIDPQRVAGLLKHLDDPLMTSEIRLQLGEGDWLIGRLRHARYWSKSQARLLALDLLERGLFASPASV
jgi:hypothetical protein